MMTPGSFFSASARNLKPGRPPTPGPEKSWVRSAPFQCRRSASVPDKINLIIMS